jgi:hypothetical protein
MNPLSILKESWRIAWHTRALWVLTLLMYITLLPATILGGCFGAVASAMQIQSDPAFRTVWNIRLPDLAPAAWVAAAGLVLLITIAGSAAGWMIQAASIRAVMAAADGGTLSVREALTLGSKRFRGILMLALTLGVLLAFLGVAPSLVILLLGGGSAMLSFAQTCLTPLTSLASIAAILILLSIAVEDLYPAAAIGSTWKVFKTGWWGYLLVLAVMFAFGILVAVLIVPPYILVFSAFSAGLAFQSGFLIIFTCAGFLLTTLVLLGLLTFSMVFSTALYSLTYRAARTGPPGRT